MDEAKAGDAPIEQAPKADVSRISLARMSAAQQRGVNASNRPAVLSHRTLEAIYRQEPLCQRGIKKHTGDLVKLGFTVILPGDEEPHEEDDLVQAWFRDGFVWTSIRDALISAHVHGDGYVEIEWDDGGAGNEPVQDGAIPVAIHVIDPLGIRFIEDEDDDGEELLYLVQDLSKGRQVTLHPDRYHHFKFTQLPGYVHGVSTIEAAYHACIAKVKGDQALGEILYSNGTPKDVAIVKDAKPGELEDVAAMLTDPGFVRGYVWDDRLTMTRLPPGALNPRSFYEQFETSIAAAIGIPVMHPKGAQAGAVEGSETNITDYHSDLRQGQVTVLEPLVARLVGPLIGELPAGFDVSWHDPPVSPDKMAVRVRDQATAFTLLKDAGITKEAAARLVGLEVDEEDFEDEPDVLPPVTPGNVPPGAQPNGQAAAEEEDDVPAR